MDESLAETRITMIKTSAGWDVMVDPLSSRMKRDGQVVSNPLKDFMSKLKLTYKLDHEGHILDVEGYEGFVDGLKNEFPDFAQQLLKIMDLEALKQQAIIEWNGSIGDFAGEIVRIGDVWEGTIPFVSPNGLSADYETKIHFKVLEPCAQTQCLRIEQEYSSDHVDTSATTKALKSVLETASPGRSDLLPTTKELSIQGKVTRLIDPKTMLVYYEEMERTMQMAMDSPEGGSIPTSMKEKRIYELKY